MFTVPGDPLAGAALGMLAVPPEFLSQLFAPPIAAVLLYAAGLILNDVCDLRIDLRQRPARPIPSGAVGVPAAIGVAAVLAALGVGVTFLTATRTAPLVAGCLLGAILAYDLGGKRVPILGPLLMGACRGLSVLLGAAALGPVAATSPLAVFVAAMVGLYIAGMTHLASRETACRRIGWPRNLPACALAFLTASIGILLLETQWRLPPHWLTVGLLAAATVLSAVSAFRLRGTPAPAAVQREIGRLIRLLLPVQAAFVLLAGIEGLIAAGVLLGFWPLAARTARRFYAS